MIPIVVSEIVFYQYDIWYLISEFEEIEFSVLFNKVPFIFDFKMQEWNKQKYSII